MEHRHISLPNLTQFPFDFWREIGFNFAAKLSDPYLSGFFNPFFSRFLQNLTFDSLFINAVKIGVVLTLFVSQNFNQLLFCQQGVEAMFTNGRKNFVRNLSAERYSLFRLRCEDNMVQSRLIYKPRVTTRQT